MIIPLIFCCCSCYTLREGSLMIGVLGAFWAFTLVFLHSFLVTSLPDYVDEGWETYTVVIFIISAIVYGIQFFAYCVLIIGAYKSNVKLLRIYVVWATVLLFFVAIIVVLNFVPRHIPNVVGGSIDLLLDVFFILVVRSFYLDLESKAGQPDGYIEPDPRVAYLNQPIQADPSVAYPAPPPDYNVQPDYQGHKGPQINPFAKTNGESI